MSYSKQMFSQLDLIREVQIRPGLWDPGQPMDSADRLEQWKSIGGALYKDWGSLNKANAYDRVLQLQKKWRSLKDAYGRDIRLRKRGVHRRTYVYFKNMTFLGGFEGLPEPPEDPPVNKDPHEYLPVNKRSHDSTDEDDIFQDDDKADHIEDPLTEPTPKKKKKTEKKRTKLRYRDVYNENEPERVEITLDSSDSNSDDSDRLFLVSFIPEIKKLPANIKMWVRAQIANIMQEAVACHLNNITPMKSYILGQD